jgi:hypothetical protein
MRGGRPRRMLHTEGRSDMTQLSCPEASAPSVESRDVRTTTSPLIDMAYRRLAVAILSVDVPSLSKDLRARTRSDWADAPAGLLS